MDDESLFSIPIAARRAMEALQSDGYEAFLVGGCVRDMVLGRIPKDWDMTTNATVTEIQAVFSRFKIIETGLKHGTVTVLIDGEALEITTYRDHASDRNSTNVGSPSFTKNLQEDLGLRDFTMNAIAYSLDTGIMDFVNGMDDIKSGIVRCVGVPDLRFQEDGLRILRALRFSAVFGFNIDETTAESIHANRNLLEDIAVERICSEITKMLIGKDIGKVLRQYADILCVVIPELTAMIGFEQHNEHHCFDVWKHTVVVVEHSPAVPVLRWAALLHDIGKPACFSIDAEGVGHFYGHASIGRDIADTIMRRLKFDNATRAQILQLILHHDMPVLAEVKRIKRYLSRFGEETLLAMIELARADNHGQSPAFRYRQTEYDRAVALMDEIVAQQACFSLKDLAVKGNDLILLGYRGKEVGIALSQLLDAVIDGSVANDKGQLLEHLKNDINKDKKVF